MAKDGTNRGGWRPGAGQRLKGKALDFRDWSRGRFWARREEFETLAWSLARAGDTALLCKWLDKAIPTPNELSVTGSVIPGAVLVCVSEDGVKILPGGGD